MKKIEKPGEGGPLEPETTGQSPIPNEDESLQEGKITRRSFLKAAAVLGSGAVLGEIGFDQISQKLREKSDIQYSAPLAKTIEQLKREFSEIDQWSNSEKWALDILTAFEENDLKVTEENLGLVLTLIRSSSGFRPEPRAIDFLPSPSESTFHQVGIKSPKTSGPLETNVQFVMSKKGISYDDALDLLAQRSEGLKLGVEFLKSIIDEYADIENDKKRIMCIFADYNAGIGASRRAGLQDAVNELSDRNLYKDGILGKNTVEAILDIFTTNNISISQEDIETDLSITGEFVKKSTTYKALCSLLGVNNLQPAVVETRVQGVTGFLKEHLTGVRTSKDYARKRFEEYMKILAIMKLQND